MELALNLVWLLASASLLGLWWVQSRQQGSWRLRELLAVAALVTLLFPVVSVTDDLLVAAKFAETDTTIRCDCDGFQPHSLLLSGDALPGFPPCPAPLRASAHLVWVPAPVSGLLVHGFFDLANRPPPVA